MTRDSYDHGRSYPSTVLSFVSGKGGVGKTIMAINTACEIAPYLDVLLIDFDLFNCGLTLWFKDSLCAQQKNGLNILTFSEVLSSYDPVDPEHKATLKLASNRKLATIPLGKNSGKIHILPCFIPDTQSQALHHTSMQPGASTLRAPKDLTELLLLTVRTLSKKHQCDIVIFDCHPGVVDYSSPCCALSDCSIVVSDFDRSSLLSGVVFTALVEKHIKREIATLISDKTRHWRVIVNRVPSPRQFAECASRLDDAAQLATHHGVQSLFSGISETTVANLKTPLALIPDLEELRDHRLEKKWELAASRRGGNGLILSAKAMIRNMTDILGSLSNDIPFCSSSDNDLRSAFDALHSKYYVDRGLGRSGITKAMLFLALLDVVLALLLLFSKKTAITLYVEGCLISLFLFAAYKMISQIHTSRRCFDMFCAISQIADKKHIEKQRHYNKGGSPATTSSIWFPKVTWFLCLLLGVSVSIKFGDLPTSFAQWLSGVIRANSDKINIAGSIIGAIAALFGSVFYFWPGFRADVKFFVYSCFFALGLIKDGDTTQYY